MFSTDKNIEQLAQLIVGIKDYIKLQKDFLQLNAVEKTVKVCTWLIVSIMIMFFIFLTLLFLSFAAVFVLSTWIHPAWAFLIVTAVNILLFWIILSNRKSLLERPLVAIFSSILSTD